MKIYFIEKRETNINWDYVITPIDFSYSRETLELKISTVYKNIVNCNIYEYQIDDIIKQISPKDIKEYYKLLIVSQYDEDYQEICDENDELIDEIHREPYTEIQTIAVFPKTNIAHKILECFKYELTPNNDDSSEVYTYLTIVDEYWSPKDNELHNYVFIGNK